MQPRPLTYRAELIGPLLTSIGAGECCSVVGMSGVGKSNMVQHMLRPDVLRQHLGASADELRFITLDTNMLAAWNAWGLFEGLQEALLSALGSDLPAELQERLRNAHWRSIATPEQYALALRQCAELFALLCTQWRIVVLFDEFDPLFAQLPGYVLRNLRGLRDRHKYRLMYLTFSRQPLTNLRADDDWDEIEPFVELLTLRELGLQPLHDEDALAEIQRFAGRHGRTISVAAQQQLVALSGGHPALLRALVQEALLAEDRVTSEREQLLHSAVMRLECAKIWQQLTGDERDELLLAAWERKPDDHITPTLLLKGLVRSQPKGASIVFSSLFAAYVKTISAPISKGAPPAIQLDPQRQSVIYYGRDISGELSPLEYGFLTYLWAHYGKICAIAEVAQELHPDDQPVYYDERSEFERVRVLAGRLRRKLATLAPGQPELFAIYRMRGYRLGISGEPNPSPERA